MRKVFNIFTSLDFGGVESHALMIAKSTYESDYKHSFIALKKGGSVSEELISIGVDVRLLGIKAAIPSISTIFKLYTLFREHKPDIVHARGAEACFHSLVAAFLARVPVRVGEEIGIPNHSKAAKLIFKWVYKFSHGVVAISDAVKNWLIESGEVPAVKIARLYNPVDFKKPSRVKCSDKGMLKVGFVGRLEPVKNPLVLVEMLASLKQQGTEVELEFLGDGSLKQEIKNLAVKLGVSNQITLHGFKDKPENYIVNCDLYVQPSISEGFGIALVEAMGLGVPVIASSVGGVPEIIEDGKTGWLLPDVSAKTITKSVEVALSLERHKLQAIGEAGRQSVVKRFTIEKYINNLDSLYENLTHEKG